MYEDAKKQQIIITENRVYEDILNALMGKDFHNNQIKQKKIKDLKAGRYKDLMVKLYPSEMRIGKNSHPSINITGEVEEVRHSLFQIYLQQLRMQQREINIQKQAVRRVQQYGIVFIDQIDKLVSSKVGNAQKQISRQGVQRDLLPILQGTVVNTKIGDIRTDNILFIACGAFSMCKVEDLLPELLGRLPIKVQMAPISQQQFLRILSEPKYNLLMQQVNLLQQQNIKLTYTPDSISQMARFAFEMNSNLQNIGARRLQMITQKIVQDISYDSEKFKGQEFIIDKDYVAEKLKSINTSIQLSRYLI